MEKNLLIESLKQIQKKKGRNEKRNKKIEGELDELVKKTKRQYKSQIAALEQILADLLEQFFCLEKEDCKIDYGISEDGEVYGSVYYGGLLPNLKMYELINKFEYCFVKEASTLLNIEEKYIRGHFDCEYPK